MNPRAWADVLIEGIVGNGERWEAEENTCEDGTSMEKHADSQEGSREARIVQERRNWKQASRDDAQVAQQLDAGEEIARVERGRLAGCILCGAGRGGDDAGV